MCVRITTVHTPSSAQHLTVRCGPPADYLYLFLFAVIIGPLCFLSFQGTKWFQYATMVSQTRSLLPSSRLGGR
jgi:hypothetical protein